jgi:YD repeat-containing protein
MSQLKTNIRLIICFIFLVFVLQFVAVPFAESVTYTYDDANRLIREEDGPGTSNEYIYDDDGNLNQKTAGSSGMFFLSVQKSGTGSGTVTSSETPAPYINCGTVCSASYAPASVVRLTASPDGVSLFSGWSGDCSGTSNSVDVVMDMTKSCRATFASNTFTVTPSAGANGTISPSTPQTVNYNSTISFTVTPNTGYHIASISGCGGPSVGSQPNNTPYTYTTGQITSDCTVTAFFSINTTTYTVTPSAGPNGTISPSTPQTVDYNSTTSFTVSPDAGYHIASVSGCGGTLTGNIYTTGPITSDCTVTASFAVNAYTVTPSAGANGTIDPSTPQTVNYNSTISFTVTPNTGYSIASVTGCGGTLSGNTYTTGPITSNCTVTASFTSSSTYSISGRVTAKGNKGLSDVTMTLSGPASATVTTDTSGNYTFTGLANGTYTVTPSKTGYRFTPTNRSVTISDANVTGQNFTAK